MFRILALAPICILVCAPCAVAAERQPAIEKLISNVPVISSETHSAFFYSVETLVEGMPFRTRVFWCDGSYGALMTAGKEDSPIACFVRREAFVFVPEKG